MEYAVGGQTISALDDVSLTVHRREAVVVIGPSGAGKTTFLTVAGALLTPTHGRVRLAGTDITALGERQLPNVRREKVGFIFQSFNLIESLTARQNVELVLETRGVGKAGGSIRAEELLRVVGLSGRMHHLPRELSGGQKQRVAIARALANNPDLILADEPTANLDSICGREIMELLRMIVRELAKTIIVVTHDPRTQELADRVFWMEDGKLQEVAPGAHPPEKYAHAPGTS